MRIGGESENIATAEGGTRRTLYAHIDRQNLPNLFRTFDFASPDAHSPERPQTLVPQQALFLMNSPVVERVAKAISHTLPSTTPADRAPDARIGELYCRILARTPTARELQLARQFLARQIPDPLPADEWSFGYGQMIAGQVEFEPLPHFAENRWQVRSRFPDEQLGYISVTSAGGHPGKTAQFSSIRRWTAPHRGTLVIDGKLQRPEGQGDGVDGLVVSSRQGVVGRWTVAQGIQPTWVRLENVTAGEHIDFVVACRANDGYDSYQWEANLTLATTSDRRTWSTAQGFHGPAARPLDLWTQLAQVLLMSNEFLYVD